MLIHDRMIHVAFHFVLVDIVGICSDSLGSLLLVRWGFHPLSIIDTLLNGSFTETYNLLLKISFELWKVFHKNSPFISKQNKLLHLSKLYAPVLLAGSDSRQTSRETTFMCLSLRRPASYAPIKVKPKNVPWAKHIHGNPRFKLASWDPDLRHMDIQSVPK